MVKKKKVLVGLSGGVDSTVTAALLLEKGYDVIGVTLNVIPDRINKKNYGINDGSQQMIEDAKKVADKLGINHHVMDFKKEFNECVISYFTNEYLVGRTPNPCITCNKYIKFKKLLEKAKEIGVDYIATGHYAVIEKDADGLYNLKKAKDKKKDQTYVLYNLTQEQLKNILMPLGNYEKSEVKEIATKLGLAAANKDESQDICFIKDNDYAKFIVENTDVKCQTGDYVDLDGNFLGKHKGIIYYTIGKRKGLGIATGKKMFVVNIDVNGNKVILGENKELFKNELEVANINIISGQKLEGIIDIEAKIRYSTQLASAKLQLMADNKAKVIFETPQRAITPGQSVVFYSQDIVLGGGVIV